MLVLRIAHTELADLLGPVWSSGEASEVLDMLQRRWPRDAFVVWFGGTLVVFSTWSANNDTLYELTRMLVASCLFCISN